MRTLRLERDLARRLTLQLVYGSANDPRYSTEAPRRTARPGLLGRFVRGTVMSSVCLQFLILIGGAAATPFLGSWLERQDYPEKADYIVPLPGDHQRLLKAADLYKQGFAPRIVLGGEPPSSTGSAGDPYEVQLAVLEKEGVLRASTARLGSQPINIAETAEALRTFAEGRKLKMIVVAAGIKSLRTKIVFEDVVPRVRFIVVSQPDGTIEQPWWASQESALRTVSEAARLARYRIAAGLRAFQSEYAAPPADAKSSPAGAPPKPVENLGARVDERRQ